MQSLLYAIALNLVVRRCVEYVCATTEFVQCNLCNVNCERKWNDRRDKDETNAIAVCGAHFAVCRSINDREKCMRKRDRLSELIECSSCTHKVVLLFIALHIALLCANVWIRCEVVGPLPLCCLITFHLLRKCISLAAFARQFVEQMLFSIVQIIKFEKWEKNNRRKSILNAINWIQTIEYAIPFNRNRNR